VQCEPHEEAREAASNILIDAVRNEGKVVKVHGEVNPVANFPAAHPPCPPQYRVQTTEREDEQVVP
jgi:hypothetical protein